MAQGYAGSPNCGGREVWMVRLVPRLASWALTGHARRESFLVGEREEYQRRNAHVPEHPPNPARNRGNNKQAAL